MMVKIFILLSLAFSLLFSAPSTPLTSPLNVGYETQKQQNIVKKQIKALKKTKKTIDDVKVKNKPHEQISANLGPSFILRGVSILGNTVFKQEEIIALIKPYIGKKVYTKTLQSIAKSITQLYHKNGYTTSRCILPQQKVKHGKVIFQIIEDRLGAIYLKGESAYEYNSRVFTQYFQKLRGKVINIKELNKQLKMLKYLPISKVSPVLQEARPGVSNLILNVSEPKEQISLSSTNTGSVYSGEYRFSLSGNINNIFGISDALFLSTTTTQMPQFYTSFNAYYRHPIGQHGSRLLWGYSHLNYQLDPQKVGTNSVFYDGSSSDFSVTYEKPIFLFNKINIWLQSSLDIKTLVSRTLQNNDGTVLVNSIDKTSVLSLGARMDFIDKYKGYNLISCKVIQAVPNLFNSMTQEDIDRKTYRLDGNATFADLAVAAPLKYGKNISAAFNKVYLSAYRQQYLPKKFIAKLSLSGEYTNKRIPIAYEYSTGDYGYSIYAALYRELFGNYLDMTIAYNQTKVYTYDLELQTTTIQNKTPILSFSSHYKKFYLSLSYQSSLESWDTNTKNIKFYASYSW